MKEAVTINSLILSAAEGAASGVETLQEADIAVELEEFEMEVTYAAETSISQETNAGLGAGIQMKFLTAKANIGTTRSNRSKATYGLKVRFLFSSKQKENNAE